MDDLEIKKAIADLGNAVEEFKSTNESALKEVKKGFADVVTTDKLQRINDAIDSLEEAKSAAEKRADELEAKMNRASLGDSKETSDLAVEVKAFNNSRRETLGAQFSEVATEAYSEYKKVFNSFVRHGDAKLLSDAERKTMSVGSEPDGGYTVPASISSRIVTRVFETSAVRPLISSETIGTDALEGLIDKDENAFGGWVTETTVPTATNTAQLGKWRIPVHEMFAMPQATQQLLDDSVIDIEAWLANKTADKMVRTENAAFITGTGVGQPRGFTTYTTAATADATRTWGQFEHVATGAAGDFVAANPADKLFDLEVAFKPQYLNNATIATRRTVVQKIRKFKDGNGQYLWQASLVAGKPSTILGYPIVLLEDMPALANNSLSLAMGDFKQAYTAVDRRGFRVVRDNLTSKPYVLFWTSRRVGGGALQFEALKFLKFCA